MANGLRIDYYITLYAWLFLLDTQSLIRLLIRVNTLAPCEQLTKHKHLKTGKTMLVLGNEYKIIVHILTILIVKPKYKLCILL